MTGRYTLSPRAQRDLDDIWDYTTGHWGAAQAQSYTRQVGKDVAMVAAQPELGRPCPEIRDGYYKYPTGSHILFYKLTPAGIDVVRILHRHMDFFRHF